LNARVGGGAAGTSHPSVTDGGAWNACSIKRIKSRNTFCKIGVIGTVH